jgi:CheY-like chemotaxis protein
MRALVVDDSRAMRKIIAGALRKLGYETRCPTSPPSTGTCR